ncbi:hypothetical protein Fmac_026544 [Flemingia macrophylla]|uniref:Uncharacterized protein n=1 Tax=Flemingia macrophylla TaxID=520843 RepID=A0ABD1LF54_9FABA
MFRSKPTLNYARSCHGCRFDTKTSKVKYRQIYVNLDHLFSLVFQYCAIVTNSCMC